MKQSSHRRRRLRRRRDVAAAGAHANGSPYSPGLVQGSDGVHTSTAPVRYVALGTARSTIVAAIRVRGGRVMRSRILRGIWGIPIVSYDGSTGGISGDGRTLVVASYGPCRESPARRASPFSRRRASKGCARSSSRAHGHTTRSRLTAPASTWSSISPRARILGIEFACSTCAGRGFSTVRDRQGCERSDHARPARDESLER